MLRGNAVISRVPFCIWGHFGQLKDVVQHNISTGQPIDGDASIEDPWPEVLSAGVHHVPPLHPTFWHDWNIFLHHYLLQESRTQRGLQPIRHYRDVSPSHSQLSCHIANDGQVWPLKNPINFQKLLQLSTCQNWEHIFFCSSEEYLLTPRTS